MDITQRFRNRLLRAEDVLDNLWFWELLRRERDSDGLFLVLRRLLAVPSSPMARSRETPAIYEGIVLENKGVADRCECHVGAAVRDKRGMA